MIADQQEQRINCLTPFLQLRSPPMRVKRAARVLSLSERARRYPFPRRLSERCDRDALRERLLFLCSQLDVLLCHPVVCRDEGAIRTVVVFGCVAYRFDSHKRRVVPGRWHRNGHFEPAEYAVELSIPLTTRAWLPWLIEDLGLSEQGVQGRLFVSSEEAIFSDDWLVYTANRLLRRDPRFRRLRREALPNAFRLDPVLTSIALAARPEPYEDCLSSAIYNMVWGHEAVFRKIARENPRLLSLLGLCVREQRIPLRREPVQELRDVFLDAGLSKAAWRYLCRYGMRYLRRILEYVPGDSRVDVVIEYLKILEEAGFPPPPTERMLHIIVLAIRDVIPEDTSRGWCVIPRDVLGIALRESATRSDSYGHQVYLEQLACVSNWAARVRPVLDGNQRHAGWAWLCREAEAWAAQQGVERPLRDYSWDSLLGEYQDDDFTVTPLTSARALVEEGSEMEHCIADYGSYCLDGILRVFSIRCAGGGARIATAAICFAERGGWLVMDVKGYANSDVRELRLLAEGIARRYNALTGRTCPR